MQGTRVGVKVAVREGDRYRVGLHEGVAAILIVGDDVVFTCAEPPKHWDGIAQDKQVPSVVEQKAEPSVDDA